MKHTLDCNICGEPLTHKDLEFLSLYNTEAVCDTCLSSIEDIKNDIDDNIKKRRGQ